MVNGAENAIPSKIIVWTPSTQNCVKYFIEIFSFSYLFQLYLKGRDREVSGEKPPGSLPECVQQPGPGQVKARIVGN